MTELYLLFRMKEDRLQLFIDAHIQSKSVDGSLGIVSGIILVTFLTDTPLRLLEVDCNELVVNCN